MSNDPFNNHGRCKWCGGRLAADADGDLTDQFTGTECAFSPTTSHESDAAFTTTDQLERELLWSALEEYKRTTELESDSGAAIDAMLKRLKQTFSWMRKD